MIVSHKHRFIFFKTRKTAGTSLQIALSEFCGEDDIITGSHKFYGKETEDHSAGINMDKFITNHPHPPLKQVKKFLGENIWNSYFKFAFVRNPYEIAVSRYHWNKKGKECSKQGFKSWVKQEYDPQLDLLCPYITDNNKIDLDFIGRYENLENDIDYIFNILKLPKPVLGKNKSGYRDKKHYTEYYDNEIKDTIKNYFSNDLEIFNYDFNNKPNTKLLPIITPNMLKEDDGYNINGPSLIKVPKWVKNRLGNYYLYFAHHNGKYIRLAYSDNIEFGWKIYEPGTLKLEESACVGHIASPDVHVNEEEKTIEMYYHGDVKDESKQKTFLAKSKDGINFNSKNEILGEFYFRVFKFKSKTFAIAKNLNTDGIIYEKINNKFEPVFNLIPNIRHTAVYVNEQDYTLKLFYTLINDNPEKIYLCEIEIDENIDNWLTLSNEEFTLPEFKWEGSHLPLVNSKAGMAFNYVNQLRDPYFYKEDNKQYLLYSIAGEKGIGILKTYIE